MKVLIAENSQILRETIRKWLLSLKQVESVGESSDVSQTIESIKNLQPDILLLGLEMPGGSGIDVLRQIKKNSQHPLTIVMTNYPYPEFRSSCLNAGADHFFDRSTEFHKIKAIFKNFIENSTQPS